MQIRDYFVSLQLLLKEWIDEFNENRIERLENTEKKTEKPPHKKIALRGSNYAAEIRGFRTEKREKVVFLYGILSIIVEEEFCRKYQGFSCRVHGR